MYWPGSYKATFLYAFEATFTSEGVLAAWANKSSYQVKFQVSSGGSAKPKNSVTGSAS